MQYLHAAEAAPKLTGMGCAPAFQLSLQVLAESSMLDVTLCDVLLMLPAGAFEVHHIKLQVTTQLGVGELQLTQTHISRHFYIYLQP